MQDVLAALFADIPRIAHEVVGSTNAEALALARTGAREAAWVTARSQTGGRGRRGRAWASPPGNLYATLLLLDPCEAPAAPQLSFVAGLALHDALSAAAPGLAERLTLKWPNDLLLDAAKVAGILVEGESLAGGAFAVAIGIGVNCVSHPEATPYPAASLATAGMALEPDALFVSLRSAMAKRLVQWNRGAAFAEVRADWLARTWRLGDAIRLRTPQETQGRFAGIDGHGRLLLDCGGDGLRTIAAGDLEQVAAAQGSGGAA